MAEPQEEPLHDSSFLDDSSGRGDNLSGKLTRPVPGFGSWSDNNSTVSSFSRLSQFFGFSARGHQSSVSDRDLPIVANNNTRRARKSKGMTALDVSVRSKGEDVLTKPSNKYPNRYCCVQLILIFAVIGLAGIFAKLQFDLDEEERQAILNCQTGQPTASPTTLSPTEAPTILITEPPPPPNDFCGEPGTDQDIRIRIAENIQLSENQDEVTLRNIEFDCIPPNAFELALETAFEEYINYLDFNTLLIRTVNLEGIGLRQVSSKLFQPLVFPQLKILRIVDNGLSELPNKFIEDIRKDSPELDELILARNAFTNIKNDIFGNTNRDFNLIDLSQNSGLVEIPPILGDLDRIKELRLSFNPSLIRAEPGLFGDTLIEIFTFEDNLVSIEKAQEATGENILEEAVRVFLELQLDTQIIL